MPTISAFNTLTVQEAQAFNTAALTASQNLSDVKGAAKTWGQTITGLVGLGGILALVQGETKIGDLEEWAEWVAIGLLILALILAVSAIYQAMVAAHVDPADDADAQGFVNNLTAASSTARNALNSSIKNALISLVLVALVAIGFWLFPEDAAAPMFLVRYVDGSAACGELTWSGATLQTEIATGAGQVADIQKVDGCPTT